MVTKETFLELLRRVLEKSKAGGIQWTQLEEGAYRVAFPGNSVLIVRHETPRSAPNCYRTFLLVNRQVVAEVTVEDESTDNIDTVHLLEELYGECFRAATGYDETIAGIEAALKAETTIGETADGGADRLSVQSATYGAGRNLNDVTAIVQGKIQDGRLTLLVTNDELGGDPCKDIGKQLTLRYTFDRIPYRITLPERSIFEFPAAPFDPML